MWLWFASMVRTVGCHCTRYLLSQEGKNFYRISPPQSFDHILWIIVKGAHRFYRIIFHKTCCTSVIWWRVCGRWVRIGTEEAVEPCCQVFLNYTRQKLRWYLNKGPAFLISSRTSAVRRTSSLNIKVGLDLKMIPGFTQECKSGMLHNTGYV